MKKRYQALSILGGVFLLSAVIGLIWWQYASQFEETDDATLAGHIHPVSARIGGTVVKVMADDNQPIKQGDLLVMIDPRDYQVSTDQARHNLTVAEIQAETAKDNIIFMQKQAISQMTQAQGEIGASKAGIRQSIEAVHEASAAVGTAKQALNEQDANYRKAMADYQRYKGADPEAISSQQMDIAATNLKVAEASRNAAQDNLAQAQARLEEAKTGIQSGFSKLKQSRGTIQNAHAQEYQVDMVAAQYQSAEAAIKTAQDAVRQAKLNESYTRVYAPVSGRVGRRTVETGQRIQAGEPLLSIVESDVWVVANFKETQLRRMRPGQSVDVSVDAFPDHPFTGRLQSFSPASGAQFALLPPENATGNFTKIVQRIPVKIVLNRKSMRGYENLLAPGMSAVVKVNL